MINFIISMFALCMMSVHNNFCASELHGKLKNQSVYFETCDQDSDLEKAVNVMVTQAYSSYDSFSFGVWHRDPSLLSDCYYDLYDDYWLDSLYNKLSKVFDNFYLGDAIAILDKKRNTSVSGLSRVSEFLEDKEYKYAKQKIDIIYDYISNFFERDKSLRRATVNRIDYENNLIIKAMITDEIDFAKVHEAIEKYTSYSNKKSTIYGLRPIEYVIGQHDFNSDNRWMNVVHSLLEKGADINIPDGPRNRTLIFKVIEEGQTDYKEKHVQLVQLLLAFNCDLQVQDELGMTPYDFALHCSKKNCSDEYQTIIQMIIKMRSNVQVDTQDVDGNTKLHRQMRNIELFFSFNDHSNVFYLYRQMRKVELFPSSSYHSNVFYLLRVCGADTSIKNYEGKKAIDLLEDKVMWYNDQSGLESLLTQTREQRYKAHIEKNKELMNAVKTTAQILIAAQQKNKELKAGLHAELLKKYPEIIA